MLMMSGCATCASQAVKTVGLDVPAQVPCCALLCMLKCLVLMRVVSASQACCCFVPHHLAGKFILFQMERARAAGADGAALEARLAAADFSSQAAVDALPLAERWIVTRVHQVRASVATLAV
jgi:hypothetical protein